MELEIPPSDDEWSGPDSPVLSAQKLDLPARCRSLPDHFYFHIRCSAQLFVDDNSFNPIFKEFCDNHFSRYIMVLENPDFVDKTPHIHIHGESCVVSTYKKMYEAWTNNKMPIGGNTVYGIRAPDPSSKKTKNHVPPDWTGYVYVCKGVNRIQPDGLPDVKGVKQFTSDDIVEFHTEYWEKVHVKSTVPVHDPNAVVVNLEEVPQVKPRRQYISWTEKTINDIRALNPDKQWNHVRDRRILVEYIMKAMGAKGRALDAMIFRRQYWSIYNGLPHTEADTNRLYDQFDSYLDAMC